MMSRMSRSYMSVVPPTIAVLVTVGFAYATGLPPFRDEVGSYDRVIGLTCLEDHPEDCELTEENIRRAHEEAGDRDDLQPEIESPAPVVEPDPRKPLPPAVNGVRLLFDDDWVVEEGQWTLGELPEQYDAPPGTPEPSFQALIESVGVDGAFISTPGFYGRYRTVVELHDRAPAVPDWCQDAAEISLRIVGSQPAFAMASFETFSDPVAVPAGIYRVRYCTEKQDRAATQEEFTGDEYTVYAGRHLLQLWEAPRAPDKVLREGSRWAQRLKTR